MMNLLLLIFFGTFALSQLKHGTEVCWNAIVTAVAVFTIATKTGHSCVRTHFDCFAGIRCRTKIRSPDITVPVDWA